MALQEEMEQQGNWLFRYRSYLPIIILFIALGVFLYEKKSASLCPTTLYFQMACLLISLVGLVIRIYTVGYTPKNTSGRNVEGQVAEFLNTSGIYSVVRHPLYLGNFFMWLGPAALTANSWFIIAFCFFYWVYYERIMFAEEQFLRRKFGTVYEDWAKKTPAFFPACKKIISSQLTFSWKKVLKKEKNGLAAVFLIFTLFDIAGKWMNNQTDYNYILILASGISVLLYLLLKYLKSYTTLLEEDGR